MPSRPIEAHSRKDIRQKPTRSNNNTTRQHGHVHHTPRATSGKTDTLLSIPPESLTHVTAFLAPPDLCALAQTCKQLNAHVNDDNTWRRAYAYRYLGITPESDLSDDAGEKTLMMRMEESSWKKEYSLRYNLLRRWEHSRNTTITHIPHHSTVSVMHLMPHTTVLAASLQYGVVSRSYPLSGKILRGFLDASGTLNGLGIGNPNAEFSPHVSSIAMTSEGGTAKILWGFRNGEVAVTTALRAMDHNRTSAARLVKCRPGDAHDGAVECVSWGHGSDGHAFFVSGGADGRVKLWEASTPLRCLWKSNGGPSLVADACVKVALNLQQGIIAAALRSGDMLAWTGFTSLPMEASDFAVFEPQEIQVPAPIVPATAAGSSPHQTTPQEIVDLRIASRSGPGGSSILVAYYPNSFLHRISLSDASVTYERTLFGDDTLAPIRTIYPVWASRRDECDFVIIGDHLGDIAMFSWGSHTAPSAVDATSLGPTHRFTAHEDGAVTALAWNSMVLVSGSSRGDIKVWDGLTLAPLRTFGSLAARSAVGVEWGGVGQILLERDALVASVGSKVLAWKAGPVGRAARHGKGKGVRVASKSSNGVAKWQQQLEMYRDITESRRELEEEQTHTRQAFGREKDQLSTLAYLGLSEVEAVEYVLMLSRDEEEVRRRGAEGPSQFGEDEGVFMADFDDGRTPLVTMSMFGSEPPSAGSSRRESSSAQSPGSGSPTSVFQGGRTYPRMLPSSYPKLQVTPPLHPEPMEASASVNSSVEVPPSVSDFDHVPAVPVSRTPSSASAASRSSTKDSVPGSPQSARSAWSTPMRSSEAPSPSWASGSASPSHSPASSLSDVITSERRTAPMPYVEEDDDIRFAIELSIAEARSRGENA